MNTHKITIHEMDTLFYPRANDATNAAGKCHIYCIITVNGLRAVPFSTKIKIVAANWIPKKKTTNDEFADTIRQELSIIDNTLRRIKIDLEYRNLPINADIIKNEYFRIKGEQRRNSFFQRQISVSEIFEKVTEKKMKMGAKYSTKRHDKYLAKLFLDYAKLKGFKNIMPNEVNLDLVESFIVDSSVSNLYIKQSVQLLSKVMAYAVRNKIIETNPLREIELPKANKKVSPIGLELCEIEKLQTVIPVNKIEEEAIDIFLFMCGTGIDFCDYNNMKSENIEAIKGKKILRITRQKTDKYTGAKICQQNSIIKEVALKILDKYGSVEKLPKFKYSSMLCTALKNIAEREKINSHLTTKRARKTFANISINYEKHTDEQTAYQMGHTSTKQLVNYRRYSDHILSSLLN